MRRRQQRPGDIYRSLATWIPIGCGIVIVGLVADLYISIQRGVSFAVIPGLVSAIIFNLMALGTWWVVRPRLLENARKADEACEQ